MKKPTILPGSLFIDTNTYSLIIVIDWYYYEDINDIMYRTEILYNIVRNDHNEILQLNANIPVSCPQLTEDELKSECISIKDDEVVKYVDNHLDELKSNYLCEHIYDTYIAAKRLGLNKAWYNKEIKIHDILDTKDGGFVIVTSASYNKDTNVYDCEGIVLSNIKYDEDISEIISADISEPRKILYDELQSYLGRYYLVDNFIKDNKIGLE